MRFSVPRSLSPSPVRKKRTPRKSCTFRVPDSSDSDNESAAGSSSDSDSFIWQSDAELLRLPPKPKRPEQSPEELRYIEDAIASIRLRVNHHDPYEDWEKETKKEAFRTARHEQSSLRQQQLAQLDQKRARDLQRLHASHKAQLLDLESRLKALDNRKRAEEQRMKALWQERDNRQRNRIESVIKFEEDKLKAQVEAERAKMEEQEAKKRAEEEMKRLEQEKQTLEELQTKLQKEKAEQAQQQREQADKETAQREQAEVSDRTALGQTTALEDWTQARNVLKRLKAGPLKTVKADRTLKSQWNKLRREIIPKIGQLTNNAQEIVRVSQEIVTLLSGPSCTSAEIYFAALSSLSKAIILQAEVEVTAEKRSAIPLALVAANLLQALEGFSEIFWAKLVQRTGGWPIPILPPRENDIDQRKLMGYREDESASEFTSRVTGLMRVYFNILVAPISSPLEPPFRLTKYWTFFARMLSNRGLLEDSPVAAELLAAALDVGGAQARELFGHQWHKMMELLYSGLTTGLDGDLATGGKKIGGKLPEGNAARVRALLEVEKVMNS